MLINAKTNIRVRMEVQCRLKASPRVRMEVQCRVKASPRVRRAVVWCGRSGEPPAGAVLRVAELALSRMPLVVLAVATLRPALAFLPSVARRRATRGQEEEENEQCEQSQSAYAAEAQEQSLDKCLAEAPVMNSPRYKQDSLVYSGRPKRRRQAPAKVPDYSEHQEKDERPEVGNRLAVCNVSARKIVEKALA